MSGLLQLLRLLLQYGCVCAEYGSCLAFYAHNIKQAPAAAFGLPLRLWIHVKAQRAVFAAAGCGVTTALVHPDAHASQQQSSKLSPLAPPAAAP